MAKNAITLLKEDHAAVKELLEQLAETTDRAAKKREQLLEKIDAELRAHARIEERILYPEFREAAKAKEDLKLYFEATEEHELAEQVLDSLGETDVTDERFGAKAKVLKDLVLHHAQEEEKEMFPRVKKLFDNEALAEMGERLATLKQAILAGEDVDEEEEDEDDDDFRLTAEDEDEDEDADDEEADDDEDEDEEEEGEEAEEEERTTGA